MEVLEGRRLLAADLASLKTLMPAWFASAKPAAPALAATVRSFSATAVASPAIATSEWIVQLNDASLKTIQSVGDAAKTISNPSLGVTVVRGLGLPGQLLVSASGAPASVRAYLRSVSAVKAFERDSTTGSIDKVPNDPRFASGDLWGLHNTGQAGGKTDADIDAPEAWDISTGSSSVVVAVIDTGIQIDHPDLKDNIWTNPGETAGDGIDNDGNGFIDDVNGWDFANNDASVYDGTFDDHGTHCAGTIAGRGNNGTGVVGVSWNAKIMSLKWINEFGGGDTSDAISAVNYATMMKSRGVNVPITSNSWRIFGSSAALKSAIDAGGSTGIMFVTSAGNSALDNDAIPKYPASYDSDCIVAVAATDRNDAIASFSNYGMKSVDLGAPGVSIVSTVPSSTYDSYDGTSMATPHVSGVAALAMAYHPSLTLSQLKESLLASVDKIPSLAGKTVSGGRLNAKNTLEFVYELANPSLKMLSVTPTGSVNAPIHEITVTFSEQVASPAVVASNFILTGDGVDGIFGTIDDVTVALNNAGVTQTTVGVLKIVPTSPLTTTERYMLTLRGTGANPLRTLKDRALGQWGFAPSGQDVVKTFRVRNLIEPNDSLSEAMSVAAADGRIVLDGTIGDGPYVSRDVDIYKVELAAGQPLTIDIDAKSLPGGSALDSFVAVFDANGKTLAFNDDDATADSFLRFTSPASGTYYVAVSGLGNGGYDPKVAGSARTGSAGDYSLALTFGSTSAALSATIGPVAPDPRASAVESIPIKFNRPVQGFDLSDVSLIRNGSPVSLAGFTLSPAADRSIWTLAGRGLQEATNASGSYGLMVKAAGSGIADLAGLPFLADAIDEWQTILPLPPPTPPSTDAGDMLAKAQLVSASATISGAIGDGEFLGRDVDLYRLVLAVGQRLVVDIDAQSRMPKSTLDSVVRVFGADGRSLAANDNDVRPGLASRDSYLEFTASKTGTYFVGVSGFGNASYDPTQVVAGRKTGSVGAYTAKITLDAAPGGLTTALAFAALPEPSTAPAKKRSAL
jgi:subtilisin family serine protease